MILGEEVFNQVYATLDDNLALSMFSPTMTPYIPSLEEANFPSVVLSQIDYGLSAETLNHRQKRYLVSLEAQVFTVDNAIAHKRVIANELADIVEETIDGYGFLTVSREVIPNFVENIYRVVLRFTGYVDLDTLTIYRFE